MGAAGSGRSCPRAGGTRGEQHSPRPFPGRGACFRATLPRGGALSRTGCRVPRGGEPGSRRGLTQVAVAVGFLLPRSTPRGAGRRPGGAERWTATAKRLRVQFQSFVRTSGWCQVFGEMLYFPSACYFVKATFCPQTDLESIFTKHGRLNGKEKDLPSQKPFLWCLDRQEQGRPCLPTPPSDPRVRSHLCTPPALAWARDAPTYSSF